MSPLRKRLFGTIVAMAMVASMFPAIGAFAFDGDDVGTLALEEVETSSSALTESVVDAKVVTDWAWDDPNDVLTPIDDRADVEAGAALLAPGLDIADVEALLPSSIVASLEGGDAVRLPVTWDLDGMERYAALTDDDPVASTADRVASATEPDADGSESAGALYAVRAEIDEEGYELSEDADDLEVIVRLSEDGGDVIGEDVAALGDRVLTEASGWVKGDGSADGDSSEAKRPELHFIVRHWHSEDDDSGSSFQGGSLEQSGDRFFVVAEGYIVPPSEDEGSYEFYMVVQDGEGTRVRVEDADTLVGGSDYIDSVDFATGTIVLSKNDLTSSDGNEIESFSSYTVSAGHGATSVDNGAGTISIRYDGSVRLVKAHAFYVKSTVDVTDGIQDDTVFGSDGISAPEGSGERAAEYDTANVYTYVDAADGHKAGDIVKNGKKPVQEGREADLPDGYGADSGKVRLTRFYDTSKGLHTDKTVTPVADEYTRTDAAGNYLDADGNPVDADGMLTRTFDVNLKTWHSEGYAPQIGLVLDASGSMAFASDTPDVINANDAIAALDDEGAGSDAAALKESLEAKKGAMQDDGRGTAWTQKVDYPGCDGSSDASGFLGYYQFMPNKKDDANGRWRTWYLNSTKHVPSTDYDSMSEDQFAKMVDQADVDGNAIDFTRQQTLMKADWGNAGVNFSEANGLALDHGSSTSGLMLEETPSGDDLTLSFDLKQTAASPAGRVEVLYIGTSEGRIDSQNYLHAYREGADLVFVAGKDEVDGRPLFRLSGLYGSEVTHHITIAISGTDLKAYVDGDLKAGGKDVQLGGRHVVLSPFDGSDAGSASLYVDNVYLFGTTLSADDVAALVTLKGSDLEIEGPDAFKYERRMDPFLTAEELELVMDPKKTDGSKLGFAGYSYFVYDGRPDTAAYVPLGYYEDGVEVGKREDLVGGDGWYYVSNSNWGVLGSQGTAKAMAGIHGNNADFVDTIDDGSTNDGTNGGCAPGIGGAGANSDRTYKPMSDSATRFYIDGNGNLRCFFGVGKDYSYTSYVYELGDKEYIRTEALQRALGLFTTQLDEKSPSARVSAVKFSSDAASSEQSVVLNWTDDPSVSTGMLSLRQGLDGSYKSERGVSQYDYALTGGTNTYVGLQAYSNVLKGADNPYGAGVDRADVPRYVIIFTDGIDSNLKDDGPGIAKAREQAAALKEDGYTIYTVLLDTGMGQESYDQAEDFLTSLSGSKGDDADAQGACFYSVRKEVGASGSVTGSNETDALTQIFVNRILNQIIHPLVGYGVKNYVDPRFDLVDAQGRTWHLGANGAIGIDGTTYDVVNLPSEDAGGPGDGEDAGNPGDAEEPATTDDGDQTEQSDEEGSPVLYGTDGLRIQLGGQTDEGADKPYVRYDEGNDMYYLEWVDQTIPGSAVGANRLATWDAQLRIKAKDDFLGGNAVVVDGNAASMNYVYAIGDDQANSGTSHANPPSGADYEESKGFPRVAVNVASPKERIDLSQTIFMGEELHQQDIAVDLIRTTVEQATGLERFYWEYLDRFVDYFNEGDNHEELRSLADGEDAEGNLTDSEGNVLVSKRLIDAAEGGSLSVRTLTGWMLEDRDVGLTLPYMFLPESEEGSSLSTTGTVTHRTDIVGQINYMILDSFFPGESDAKQADSDVYPNGPTTHTKDRCSALQVTYRSDASEDRMLWNNEHVITDDSYPRDPDYKPVPGAVAKEVVIDGTFTTRIVSGEIALQALVSDEAAAKLRESGTKVTYDADLYLGDEKVGTFTAVIDPGETLANATIEYEGDYANGTQGAANMGNYGLPQGVYTLRNGAGSNVPEGFSFGDIQLITDPAQYDPSLFSKGVGHESASEHLAHLGNGAFVLGAYDEGSGESGSEGEDPENGEGGAGGQEGEGPEEGAGVDGLGMDAAEGAPSYATSQTTEADGRPYTDYRFGLAQVKLEATDTLTVRKAVVGDAPAEVTGSIEYEFEIAGPAEVAGNEYETDRGDAIEFSEGEEPVATISVTGPGSVTIEGLPDGTYSVTERDEGASIEGYALKVTGEGEAVISAESGASITVTNQYLASESPDPGTTRPDDNEPAANAVATDGPMPTPTPTTDPKASPTVTSQDLLALAKMGDGNGLGAWLALIGIALTVAIVAWTKRKRHQDGDIRG